MSWNRNRRKHCSSCRLEEINFINEKEITMECGWERIYRRLEAIGRLDVLKCPTQIHNFATDDEVAK